MSAAISYEPHQLIKDAAKHGELVVFVGAGASKLCGSPDWREFANQVVDALERADVLTFLEAEQLRAVGDPRRTLSIAIKLAKEKQTLIDFDTILHPVSPKAPGIELYRLLAELRPVFVTTNYDKWLDKAVSEPPLVDSSVGSSAELMQGPVMSTSYYRREHLTSEKLAERGTVIHLHGSYSDETSMVVSLRDYTEHYMDPTVQTFLSEMFRHYTVLFVGYGLSELEILEHIIRSNVSQERKHFILYAHRTSEVAQTGFIERFFKEQCGIEVLPYCIDFRGYRELINVFKSWKTQLDVRDLTLLDLQASLDRCIANGAIPIQRESAMRMIQRKPELTAYFVNSLRDPQWFDDLELAGLFNTKHSPGLKLITGREGQSYEADAWPALRYLEHVASLVNGERATKIAEVVRRVTGDAEARNLNNWRTSWSLAIILSRLPLDVITESDIDLARAWLRGGFESNVVGRELGNNLLPRLLDSEKRENWTKALRLLDALTMVRTAERAV